MPSPKAGKHHGEGRGEKESHLPDAIYVLADPGPIRAHDRQYLTIYEHVRVNILGACLSSLRPTFFTYVILNVFEKFLYFFNWYAAETTHFTRPKFDILSILLLCLRKHTEETVRTWLKDYTENFFFLISCHEIEGI